MTDSAGLAQIDAPHLLLTFIPFDVDENDRVWLDPSWLRDFERHGEYIRQLTLVAPRHRIGVTSRIWCLSANGHRATKPEASPDVLGDRTPRREWMDKLADPSAPPAVLFAGRLTHDKGVEVLLEAIRLLRSRGRRVGVDIIGDGPPRDVCKGTATLAGTSAVKVLDPVPYGDPFFALLQRYHAVVVPSLGQEQPRILFDAFSQAVPVIASGTDGIRPHVIAG